MASPPSPPPQALTRDLQPLFVSIPGLANFRDVGGWPIEGAIPSAVRTGLLFRGPDPATVTDQGLLKLRETIGVRTDFDLRSRGQIEKAGGVRPLDGIERVWAPAFPDEEYSPERAARRYVLYASEGTDGIVEAFTEILTHGAPACRTLLLHIAAQAPASPDACYIHCTTGNNRSGVFVAIILSLLGVSPALVAEEYALSDIGLTPIRDRVVDRLMQSPVFARSGGGGRARAERMVGARKESMIAMLAMVRERWGGAEGYVKMQCGLTDEEIARVRRVLIKPDLVAAERRKSRAWETTRKVILMKLRNAFS
ncbi:tyrosine phosphatase [Drepanopeziza brunnea f. sp. 'multigermtubi' MB_m1]|uniref:Tyrosine phosphatase n=1 Tax=Marssonina brunnea f. sp. multigermtubi (strain MB_m1) TaxID=1072389 RepID=K1X823_MARBU|nr:tyrosine phosphatase [Drepanopeziza brunnea f. sp. 'multigermtubi' MB_m1]EKD21212.1 tyrosine phosphatase [Drepanopeziza brunnea f. sp. 'multigermtubi' MB_m1]